MLISGQTFTDDSLLIFFAKAEFIVNSKPLTSSMLDLTGEEPSTPNHLLMLLHRLTIPLEFLQKKTTTCANAGAMLNTWLNSFGYVGGGNTSKFCKRDLSGSRHK